MTDIKKAIFAAIADLMEAEDVVVNDDTLLLGDGSVLDSMKVVTLCLTLEDMAAEQGFEFDWTSDAAMSRSRSMFRSAGSLVSEFIAQMQAKA